MARRWGAVLGSMLMATTTLSIAEAQTLPVTTFPATTPTNVPSPPASAPAAPSAPSPPPLPPPTTPPAPPTPPASTTSSLPPLPPIPWWLDTSTTPPTPRLLEPVPTPPASPPRRLLSLGVTFGLAADLELGKVFPNDQIAQENPELTAMPYVVVAPAYWFSTPALDRYCAALGTVSDETREALRAEASAPGRSACAAHVFGAYLGRALSYDAKTTFAGGSPETRVRTVDTHVSFGIALLPTSAFSLLFGVTFSDVSSESGSPARLVTPQVAAGLNFDALSLL